MSDTAQLLTGIGGLLVGIAAVTALIKSGRAERTAAEAKATSPQAIFEGLRTQVQQVVEVHEDAVRRWQAEREGMEVALRNERARADGAELVALQLQGQLAEIRIDFAASRAEVAELRQRFDAAIDSVH
jgi:hypothetical protein